MAVILGIMPLVAAAIKPICGYVIDRTQNATAVVLVLLLILASFTGAVFMSPRSGTEAKYTEGLLDCSRGTFTAVDPSSELFPGFQGKSSAYLQCTLYFLGDVMLPVEVQGGSATEVELVNASLTCGALDNRNPTTWNANATARLSCRCDSCSVVVKNVWLYAVSIVITGAVSTTLYTVSDSATCELLNDNPRAYGRQRLWGSTGWGIISTVIGFYMGKASSGGDGHTDYTPGFYVLAALTLLNVILIVSSPRLRTVTLALNFFTDLANLFGSIEVVAFTLWTFLMGALITIVSTYSTWFLEDMDASPLMIGAANSVRALVEVPIFFVTSNILEKLGYFFSYSAVFLLFGVKFIAYSFLRNSWYGMLVEIASGASSPIAYATLTVFAKEVAKPGTSSTMLCILGAVLHGIGKFIFSRSVGHLPCVGWALSNAGTSSRHFTACCLIRAPY